jgi:hypothetical protein
MHYLDIMNWKRISIPLVIILGLLAFIETTEAVIKAGSKCSKVNVTFTVAGRKYTCVKSGGTIVWNKGVLVKNNETLKAGVCPQFSTADKNSGISVSRANTFIGMKEGEAESRAAQLDWIYRVVSREGEDFPATLDYRVDRISVTIKNGIISRANVG